MRKRCVRWTAGSMTSRPSSCVCRFEAAPQQTCSTSTNCGNWHGFRGYPTVVFDRLCRAYPSEGEAIRRELTEGVLTDPATFTAQAAALAVAFRAYLAGLDARCRALSADEIAERTRREQAQHEAETAAPRVRRQRNAVPLRHEHRTTPTGRPEGRTAIPSRRCGSRVAAYPGLPNAATGPFRDVRPPPAPEWTGWPPGG